MISFIFGIIIGFILTVTLLGDVKIRISIGKDNDKTWGWP